MSEQFISFVKQNIIVINYYLVNFFLGHFPLRTSLRSSRSPGDDRRVRVGRGCHLHGVVDEARMEQCVRPRIVGASDRSDSRQRKGQDSVRGTQGDLINVRIDLETTFDDVASCSAESVQFWKSSTILQITSDDS